MSNLKKKIPLTVLEILEPFLQKGNEKVRLVNPDKFLLNFVDSESTSDFHFIIENYKTEKGIFYLLVTRKPRSKNSVDGFQTWIDAKQLEQYFTEWLMFIEKYDQIKTIYDDPIEKKYREEFYAEFEIIDDDADTSSFNLNQQLWIDNYLDRVLLALENHTEEKSNPEIQEIIKETLDLKKDLTKTTKKVIVQKLSKIWALARKHGLTILKEIYVEFRNELIKQLIQGQLTK